MTGCGNKEAPEEKKAASKVVPPANPAPEGTFTFDEVLARAKSEEPFYTGLNRLLLTRSVLFALDTAEAPEVDAEGTPQKFSIKVMKAPEGSKDAAFIFSSKEALALAGEQFGWEKNEKGMYGFAAMGGKDAFRVLQSNGYERVILDAASPNAHMFGSSEVAALAAGELPPFRKSA